jgi:peptidoglycan/LPS O-acetylase OafA/YrhL
MTTAQTALDQTDSPRAIRGSFRRDIEGLRGIAVSMVVFGHAAVTGFSGGFIGVDIFFVISGFLITGLLLRELRVTAHVDFFAFYARRVRRLLPAFSLMAVCAMLCVVFVVPGTDQKLQASSGLWAALWSSNIFFSVANFGYFDASARDSIYLHTWSLGVEEQFYLLWPALLLFVWKLSAKQPMRIAVGVIAFIVVVGFLASLIGTLVWPVGGYYLMPFRLWELAAGGFCCALPINLPRSMIGLLRLGGALGLSLLAAGCVLLTERVAYPGCGVLLPVIGAALLISSGTLDSTGLVSRWLASPPLTFVGRLSYSWYLWHWPVLVIARRSGHNDAIGMAVATVISFGVALSSYWFVERLTRHRRIRDARQFLAAGVFASALLALMPSLWRMTVRPAGQNELASSEQRVRASLSAPQIYSIPGCDDWYSSDRLVPCVFGDGKGPTAVVIGDSLGLHLFPALQRLFGDAGWTLVVLTKSSCPVVDEPFFYERIHRNYTECETWLKSAIAYVQQTKPDIVIVGSAGSYPYTLEQWTEGSRRAIGNLKVGARNVVVLAPTPRLPFDGPNCAISHAATVFSRDGSSDCTARLADVEDQDVAAALARAVVGLAGTAVINVNDAICPNGVCAAVRGGRLVYRDSQHLNAPYALGLAGVLADRLAPYMAKRERAAAP